MQGGLVLFRVKYVLRSHPNADILHHVAPLISEFWGLSQHLSLSRACYLGSIPHLEWYWQHTSPFADVDAPTLTFEEYLDSAPHRSDAELAAAIQGAEIENILYLLKDLYNAKITAAAPEWSLPRFLRSQPQYFCWQFTESMKVAAEQGDLAVIQWLLEHIPDFDVNIEVINTAIRNGQLHILQFLLDHDAGQRGDEDTTRMEVNPATRNALAFRVVCWGSCSVQLAARCKLFEIAKWLLDHVPQEYTEEEAKVMIKTALENGDTELAELLVPNGKKASRLCAKWWCWESDDFITEL